MVVAAIEFIDALPLVAVAPLQPPEAVQVDALLVLHVRVELAPGDTVVGVAAIATVGCAAALPSMVTMAEVWLPSTAPVGWAIATASALVPLNGVASLTGMLILLGVESPAAHCKEPCADE